MKMFVIDPIFILTIFYYLSFMFYIFFFMFYILLFHINKTYDGCVQEFDIG